MRAEIESWYAERDPDLYDGKADWIAEEVFNLTAYDSYIASEMGSAGMDVFKTITGKTTFDYIKDPEKYRQYLHVVNWPFFIKRLDWGTSIRGAWWDHRIGIEGRVTPDKWDEFCKALIDFWEGKPCDPQS